jgi:hypothetical protein
MRHAPAGAAEREGAVRTTRAGIVMCEAIEGFAADGYHWQMLIGATLPILRREAYLAFCNEKELRS